MEINITIKINLEITAGSAETYFDGLLDRIRLDIAQRGWPAPDLDAWLTFPAQPTLVPMRLCPRHQAPS